MQKNENQREAGSKGPGSRAAKTHVKLERHRSRKAHKQEKQKAAKAGKQKKNKRTEAGKQNSREAGKTKAEKQKREKQAEKQKAEKQENLRSGQQCFSKSKMIVFL